MTTMTAASTIASQDEILQAYLASRERPPLFVVGNALDTLRALPAESIDLVMTSPPYWGQRAYAGGGIGLEDTYPAYILGLLDICAEVKRVLKRAGSFWLNVGDAYSKKCQLCIPWRIAIAMTDTQGWILRNDIVWNKVKGGWTTQRTSFATFTSRYFTSSSRRPITTIPIPFGSRRVTPRWSTDLSFPQRGYRVCVIGIRSNCRMR